MHEHDDHAPEALNPRRAMLAGLGGLAAGALLATTANAGPLTPPPGPISSTPGPEPRIPINQANTPGDANSTFRITQPGSYYLTENLIGEAGKHGIEIASSGVCLDLNGFDVIGVQQNPSFAGILSLDSALQNIAVVNGSVQNWGIGLCLSGPGAVRVERIIASNNSNTGIDANIGIVSNCAAADNGGNGINLEGGVISHCTTHRNGSLGIQASFGVIVTDCHCLANTQHGISAGSHCFIKNCICLFNGNGGVGAGVVVTGMNCRIEGNNCTSNDFGIQIANTGNLILANPCSDNTTNYSITPGNRFGPIVNIAGSGTPAVSGNSAASTLATTDPFANFAY